MSPPISAAFWWHLFGALALQTTLAFALAWGWQRCSRSGLWHRTAWRIALLAAVALVVGESAGLSRALIGWIQVQMVPHHQPPSLRLTAAVAPAVMQPIVIETTLEEILPIPPPAITPRVEESPSAWWPGVMWLCGAGCLLARLVLARVCLAFFWHRQPVGDEPLSERVRSLARRLGVRRRIRVVQNPRLTGPMTFGILRPLIGLPAGFSTRFTLIQQEAMLAHELAHVAAGDPLWTLLADAVCALLWWQPLVWWARRRLRAANEAAADEASLLVENGPEVLAECLVKLGARLTRARSFGGLGIEGHEYRSGLGRRVKRLVGLGDRRWKPLARTSSWLVHTIGSVVIVTLSLGSVVWSQPEEAFATDLSGAFRNSVLGLTVAAVFQAEPSAKTDVPKSSDPAVAAQEETTEEKISWQPWSEDAVTAARANGHPVLINFTADWCVTAKVNERTSLDVPAVRAKMRELGVVTLRADNTVEDSAITAELRKFDRPGLPLVVVYAASADVEPKVMPEVLTLQIVLDALAETIALDAARSASKPGAAQQKDPKNDTPKLILEGKSLLESGKLAEAESKLQEALKLDPENGAAKHYLGLLQQQRERARTTLLPQPLPTEVVPEPPLGDLPFVGRLFKADSSPKTADPQASEAEAERSRLHTRWFKVDPNTLGVAAQRTVEVDGRPSGGQFKGVTFAKLTTTNGVPSWIDDVKGLLSRAGVDFTPPKAMFFNHDRGMLMVRATLQDLDLVEQVIQVLNTPPLQVMIEVRFCEITEEDRRALGIDWILHNQITNAPAATGQGALTNATLTTTTGILTEPQFRVTLRALEQRRGVNVLSTPKVTTLSGRQAQIKAVEVRYVVTDLDFTTNGLPRTEDGRLPTPRPIAEQFELGPIIDVVPHVLADGFTISMTVIPSIKEFFGYDLESARRIRDWVEPNDEAANPLRAANPHPVLPRADNSSRSGAAPLVPLPIFRLRQIIASATVWDGQTLVLSGGLTTYEQNGQVSANDSLAQKGATRLFGGQKLINRKKSLLVFVTPTIIDSAGNRVHPAESLAFRQDSVPPQKPDGSGSKQ